MNASAIMEVIALNLQISVLLPIIFLSAKLMKGGKQGIFPAVFTFAMVGLMLSCLYNSLNSLLTQGDRMPFAADEIAECSMLLLLSAGLESMVREKEKVAVRELIFSIAFIGANIILWIAWSGEWLQDTLFGIPYVYFLYLILRGVRRTNALTSRETLIAAILSGCIMLTQFFALWMEKESALVIENIFHIPEFIIIAWLFWKSVRALKKENAGEQALYLSFLCFLWSLLVTYMCGELCYSLALIINTVTLPVMLLAMKKKELQNDLR